VYIHVILLAAWHAHRVADSSPALKLAAVLVNRHHVRLARLVDGISVTPLLVELSREMLKPKLTTSSAVGRFQYPTF
jgi:hypothetical protein